MTIAIRVLLVLAACALVGSPVTAETGQDEEIVSGTVVSSGNLSLVIDADDGRRTDFVLDGATTFPNGRPSVGSPVVIRYRGLDSARSQALTVTRFEPADIAAAPLPAASPAPAASDEIPFAITRLEPAWAIVAINALAAICLLFATLRLVRSP